MCSAAIVWCGYTNLVLGRNPAAAAHRRKVSESRPCFHISNQQPRLRLAPSVPSPEVDVRSDPDRASTAPPWSDSRWRPAARSHRRRARSEEHTSELQSPDHLVCRLLLEKKKI